MHCFISVFLTSATGRITTEGWMTVKKAPFLTRCRQCRRNTAATFTVRCPTRRCRRILRLCTATTRRPTTITAITTTVWERACVCVWVCVCVVQVSSLEKGGAQQLRPFPPCSYIAPVREYLFRWQEPGTLLESLVFTNCALFL